MPEQNPAKDPTILLGTVIESGTPNTGQIRATTGGTRTYNLMSGQVGPDIRIWAGAGRLDTVIFHPQPTVEAASGTMYVASGLPIIFYDGVAAISGGPFNTSGHKVVAALYPIDPATLGALNYRSGLTQIGRVVQLGVPFNSGLVHTTRSGQPGFTAAYTPVFSG